MGSATFIFAKPYRCLVHGERYADLVITVSTDPEELHSEHVYCGLCLDAAFLKLGLAPMERIWEEGGVDGYRG